jgi:hypothetical protein
MCKFAALDPIQHTFFRATAWPCILAAPVAAGIKVLLFSTCTMLAADLTVLPVAQPMADSVCLSSCETIFGKALHRSSN